MKEAFHSDVSIYGPIFTYKNMVYREFKFNLF